MDEYEEKIYKHDSDLYHALYPYVGIMPDFRPEETVKRMKGSYVGDDFSPRHKMIGEEFMMNLWLSVIEKRILH